MMINKAASVTFGYTVPPVLQEQALSPASSWLSYPSNGNLKYSDNLSGSLVMEDKKMAVEESPTK